MLHALRRSRHRVTAVLAVAAATATAVSVVSVPAASAAGGISNVNRTRYLSVAPGIAQYRETFRTADGFPQSAWITSVNLAVPGVRLAVQASHTMVNTGGETVLSMAQRTRSLAGINGDLFDFGRSGAPYGGEVVNGRIVKNPLSSHVGQLAVLSNGKAVLGQVVYKGSFARADKATVKHGVWFNDVPAARRGGITFLNSRLGTVWVPSTCVLASMTYSRGLFTVSRLSTRLRIVPQLASTSYGLLGCGTTATRWLQTYARSTTRFRAATTAYSPAYPTAKVVSAIQGAKMVIRNGVRYTDTSTGWSTSGHNPETFVCVAKNRTSILLGTIDGRLYRAVGVTFPQVTNYMLVHGCYDGLVMDGGGSTTTVGPQYAGGPLGVRNTPAWGGQPRPIANGIFASYTP